jgi:bacteriorhodopsin
VAFPVVTTALGILSGVSWASILYNVVLAWIWDIAFLVSSFTTTNYKWGFFAFGMLAWFVHAFGTFTNGRSYANHLGIVRDYSFIASWFHALWLLYIIAFAVSDGSHRIGVVGMFVWFGILDSEYTCFPAWDVCLHPYKRLQSAVLLIPGTAFVTLFLSRKWDYGRLNLHFTQSGRVHHSGSHSDKHIHPISTAGPTRDGVLAH